MKDYIIVQCPIMIGQNDIQLKPSPNPLPFYVEVSISDSGLEVENKIINACLQQLQLNIDRVNQTVSIHYNALQNPFLNKRPVRECKSIPNDWLVTTNAPENIEVDGIHDYTITCLLKISHRQNENINRILITQIPINGNSSIPSQSRNPQKRKAAYRALGVGIPATILIASGMGFAFGQGELSHGFDFSNHSASSKWQMAGVVIFGVGLILTVMTAYFSYQWYKIEDYSYGSLQHNGNVMTSPTVNSNLD